MGEDTTGRTLTEELCFMLFFGLNRGKRHFLMTGGLPSGTSICNIEAHDWWHRETWAHDKNKKKWFYISVKVLIWKSIKRLKSRRRARVCRQTALQTRCWHQRTYAWNSAFRHDLHPQNYLTYNSPFEIFSFSSLLLWRNPASPFLWMAQIGSTLQYLGQSWK